MKNKLKIAFVLYSIGLVLSIGHLTSDYISVKKSDTNTPKAIIKKTP